jgi:hypothetical protein
MIFARARRARLGASPRTVGKLKLHCITAKFEKSHPALSGHYYAMKNKWLSAPMSPGTWVAMITG